MNYRSKYNFLAGSNLLGQGAPKTAADALTQNVMAHAQRQQHQEDQASLKKPKIPPARAHVSKAHSVIQQSDDGAESQIQEPYHDFESDLGSSGPIDFKFSKEFLAKAAMDLPKSDGHRTLQMPTPAYHQSNQDMRRPSEQRLEARIRQLPGGSESLNMGLETIQENETPHF